MKLSDVLAGKSFECEDLPDGEIPIDVVVIVRSVDTSTGEEILNITKTRATSIYTAIGMLSEASLDQSPSVSVIEEDDDGD